MKSRFFSVLAIAAAVSFAACEADEVDEGVVVDEPVAEEAVVVEPPAAVVPVAPMTDTAMVAPMDHNMTDTVM